MALPGATCKKTSAESAKTAKSLDFAPSPVASLRSPPPRGRPEADPNACTTRCNAGQTHPTIAPRPGFDLRQPRLPRPLHPRPQVAEVPQLHLPLPRLAPPKEFPATTRRPVRRSPEDEGGSPFTPSPATRDEGQDEGGPHHPLRCRTELEPRRKFPAPPHTRDGTTYSRAEKPKKKQGLQPQNASLTGEPLP
jgi:hypothetical protein